MRRHKSRAIGLVLALMTVPALAMSPASAAPPSSPKLSPATLTASGATFPLGFYQVAIGDYKKVQKAVTINYQGVGSGTGRQNFIDQVVDFAGSDAPFAAA